MSGQSRRVHRVEGEKWTLRDLRGRSVQEVIQKDHTLTIAFPRGIKLIVKTDEGGMPMTLAISQEKMVKQEVESPIGK